MTDLERRLLGILSADVTGFSRLMADDTTENIAALRESSTQIGDAVVANLIPNDRIPNQANH